MIPNSWTVSYLWPWNRGCKTGYRQVPSMSSPRGPTTPTGKILVEIHLLA